MPARGARAEGGESGRCVISGCEGARGEERASQTRRGDERAKRWERGRAEAWTCHDDLWPAPPPFAPAPPTPPAPLHSAHKRDTKVVAAEGGWCTCAAWEEGRMSSTVLSEPGESGAEAEAEEEDDARAVAVASVSMGEEGCEDVSFDESAGSHCQLGFDL